MVSRAAQLAVNKVEGNQLEAIFERSARLQGFATRKVPLSGQWGYDGAFKPIDSELDFQLILEGAVGYVDTKCFQSDFFAVSQLNKKQIERAKWYNDYLVPAGLVVWFKPINKIVFFSGNHLLARSAFHWQDGLQLGTFENFNLRLIVGPNGYA